MNYSCRNILYVNNPKNVLEESIESNEIRVNDEEMINIP